jgi:predicted RNA polymerase sigma factor
MRYDERQKELEDRAWKHIAVREFAEAETALRQLIDTIDADDAERLWHLHAVLAGVLNGLSRAAEGTDMYRRALAEARRLGDTHFAVGHARYTLANQYLTFGDPRDALAETDPVPAGSGHIQSLLHAVSAQALWKLDRRDEARLAAQRSIDTSPHEEWRVNMTRDLAHILSAG